MLTALLAVSGIALLAAQSDMETSEGAFEVGGINYEIIGSTNTAKVVAKTPKYTGEVTIPASVLNGGNTCSVVEIASVAFLDCNGLVTVVLPNSVTFIGTDAFRGCVNLTSINLENVTGYGTYVFGGDAKLNNVSLNPAMTGIPVGLFS